MTYGGSYNFTSNSGAESFTGELASYPGSGYIVDVDTVLPIAAQETFNRLEVGALHYGLYLTRSQAQEWTDHLSRALFLETNLYNANINKWSVVRVLFEMPVSGGVRATTYFGNVKFNRHLFTNQMPFNDPATQIREQNRLVHFGFRVFVVGTNAELWQCANSKGNIGHFVFCI